MSRGFRVVASSHVGAVRVGNEDAGLASNQIIAVADGMGGHAAGEIASAAVIQSLANSLAELPNTSEAAHDWIVQQIDAAHGFIGDLIAANKERQGMGTTLSLLLFCDDQLVMGQIGDSRVYRLTAGKFSQISTDHTYVQSLVDSGEITAEEAQHHPRKNLLMRAIDGVHEVEVDIRDIEVTIGDRFLVCSDGLTGVLSNEVLQELLQKSDLTFAASQMIEYALAAGAPDNVTVALAEVVADAAEVSPFMVGCAAVEELSATAQSGNRILSRRRFSWRWFLPILVLVAGLFATNAWLENQWFVKSVNQSIYVYQGIPQGIGPIELSRVVSESQVSVNDLAESDQIAVARGITANSKSDAERILSEIESRASCANSTQGCSTP